MSLSTTTSTTNITTADPSISSDRKGSSLLDDPAFSSTEQTVATDTNPQTSSTMSPPAPGHEHSKATSSERRRRRSSGAASASSHARHRRRNSSSVPGMISLPAPGQPSGSFSVPQQLSHHPRTLSNTSSQSGRSPSPGATGFVLPPGVSISQITPNVFVGNNASSTSIPTLMHYGITSMVSLLSPTEKALNEDVWNSAAFEVLVPKQNRLYVRCEDSPEEDLVGRLGMICDFIDAQIDGGAVPSPGGSGHSPARRRKPSVEDVLENVLPASEVPTGFNAAGHQPEQPKQRVRSLIPDDNGNFESPTQPQPQPEPEKKESSAAVAGPAPQKQRVRSLIPDDDDPVPSVPSGSIPSVPSAPVPSLPGSSTSTSTSHLDPTSAASMSASASSSGSRSGSDAASHASQLSALSPEAQAGPGASSQTRRSPSRTPSPHLMESTGGKVLIHCNQGVSRSGTVCVAYIMKRKKASWPHFNVDNAVRWVQARRREIEPSRNFMKQLEVWWECQFNVYVGSGATSAGEGLEVDGKSIDGKRRRKDKGKEEVVVPKHAYEKWLKKREETIKRVREMGGLVTSTEDLEVSGA